MTKDKEIADLREQLSEQSRDLETQMRHIASTLVGELREETQAQILAIKLDLSTQLEEMRRESRNQGAELKNMMQAVMKAVGITTPPIEVESNASVPDSEQRLEDPKGGPPTSPLAFELRGQEETDTHYANRLATEAEYLVGDRQPDETEENYRHRVAFRLALDKKLREARAFGKRPGGAEYPPQRQLSETTESVIPKKEDQEGIPARAPPYVR
jgi:hypothetical protein